ncbi:MAG: putative response regulator in two-component reguatory system, sigma54 dependent transcriptional [candidate division NC10 bacterium]|nr:putative response regulator in two-component reguatory system, sigma54 dependent transcriptional [candidate division NC10 bacterium]
MTKPRSRILIVDDDPDILELLSDRLQLMRFEVACAKDGQEALSLLRQEAPPLTLLDLQLPRLSGMDVLHAIRREGLETTVIVITALGTPERAVEAMRAGAYDFIPKPLDPGHLEVVINKALERESLRAENWRLHSELEAEARPIIGRSPAVQDLIRTAKQAAASNATVLLRGESGTGKEILARAIHRWSPRRDEPLVIVNCVALSEELLESELFGHEKGAFTGAHQRKRGKAELADGGTLFLDEVGDIRAPLQAKLLRLLQEHEFERVGGTRPIRVDARFIAATNANLEQAMKQGMFRQDLYYRLNVVSLCLPPLRARREDIDDLANHFVAKYCAELKRPPAAISPAAMTLLRGYDWPGNIRELENAIERAVVLSSATEIEPRDLPIAQTSMEEDSEGAADSSYRLAVLNFKRELLRSALLKADGNQTRTAEALGLQRTYLSRLLRELGLREI